LLSALTMTEVTSSNLLTNQTKLSAADNHLMFFQTCVSSSHPLLSTHLCSLYNYVTSKIVHDIKTAAQH